MTRLSEWTEAKVEEWLAYREGVGLAPDHHYLAAWLDDQRRAALADPETQAAMRADVDPQGAAVIEEVRAFFDRWDNADGYDLNSYIGPLRLALERMDAPSVSDKGADTDG